LLLGMAACAAVLLPAAAAQAVTTVSFDLHNDHFTLTMDDALNGLGGHNVFAVSGVANGEAVLGILPTLHPPNIEKTANGQFNIDNIWWDTGAHFDFWGLGFFTASLTGDIYATQGFLTPIPGNTNYTELFAENGAHVGDYAGSVVDNITNIVTTTGGVPEPATWALMLIGFGTAGFALRHRRRTSAALA
jgi:opacity protein-like surface antigen